MSEVTPTVMSGIDSRESTTRQVPKQDFSKVLKESLATTTRVIVNGVAVISPELDVSKTLVSTMSRSLAEKSAEVENKEAIINEGGTSINNNSSTSIPSQNSSANDLLSATKALQEANWQFSLEYLNLQEKVSSENRYFSTVSNIMRTRHDSAKNAINNLR
ncbi:MAG: hypothetical protein ACP5QK_07870 [Myxococcota bacterium]